MPYWEIQGRHAPLLTPEPQGKVQAMELIKRCSIEKCVKSLKKEKKIQLFFISIVKAKQINS